MSKQHLYLAIDQGSHASRAIVFDASGSIQARAKADIHTLKPLPGWVEHEPSELIGATRQVIDDIGVALGPGAKNIRAAGFATQRSSIACWNPGSGATLSPIISWQDRRAADWLRQFENREERVHEITGLVLSPHYGASKLRWCNDHIPEVATALDDQQLAYGPLSSFLTYSLCEEHPLTADPANASRTLLWDYRQRDWSDELLDLFGLSRSCLPASVPSRFDFGSLRVGNTIVPLSVVTGDQSAALFGFGAPTSDTVYVNLGTGAFIQQVVDGAPVFAPDLLSSVVYQDAERAVYVLEGTVNGAGSAIRAVAQELEMDQEYLEANSAAWLDTIEDPPLFLNGIGGLGAPFWVPDFPTRFVGKGDKAEKIAAVMESIVFLLTTNLEAFSEFAPRPERMLVTGGLANVDPLCQCLADLSGLPVSRPRIREATAKGLAYLLADRPDDWSAPSRPTDYSPATNLPLQQRYQRWQQEMRTQLDAVPGAG
ncbi:MAG: FGGY family carbohydrate kinase [Gammaproteobacteria bacterium]|nr:FGGY family carbohydrate kinase [Gammaproteobacteria bacterium]